MYGGRDGSSSSSSIKNGARHRDDPFQKTPRSSRPHTNGAGRPPRSIRKQPPARPLAPLPRRPWRPAPAHPPLPPIFGCATAAPLSPIIPEAAPCIDAATATAAAAAARHRGRRHHRASRFRQDGRPRSHHRLRRLRPRACCRRRGRSVVGRPTESSRAPLSDGHAHVRIIRRVRGRCRRAGSASTPVGASVRRRSALTEMGAGRATTTGGAPRWAVVILSVWAMIYGGAEPVRVQLAGAGAG